MGKYSNMKKYKALHPNLLGLPEKKKDYIFTETEKGYLLTFNIGKEMCWIGYPKQLIEGNDELFKLIDKKS